MRQYNHSKIEKKWQRQWDKEGIYTTKESSTKPSHYVLDMFPYPSGEGLHVGHPKGYIATDIYSRFKRMNGYNVLHPMGWDAFGLPAENYAIQHGIHPRKAVTENIKYFKKQLQQIGLDYDWSREINTTEPEYYRWTQWIFLQMYKHGLAYQSYEPINWCPSCMTGLANEDVEDGQCERCKSDVEEKPLRQWVLWITHYADDLLRDLEGLNWPESIKESQRNWIGRSEGARISFPVDQQFHFVLIHGYQGKPGKNFFPWLKRALEKQGHTVEVPKLPSPDHPNVEEQINYVRETCHFNEHTVILGHSLGAAIAMGVLERLKAPVAQLITAGGVIEPTSEDREYADTFPASFNFDRIKRNARRIVVLRDENDDTVPATHADRIAQATGGTLYNIVARKEHFTNTKEPDIFRHCDQDLRVFTTRPDTIYGATYMVVAPEHPMIDVMKPQITNWQQVKRYRDKAGKRSEIERTAEGTSKTGVPLEGVWALNPATDEQIPVYAADYVLYQHGTGAIMAVPAHDERDWEFANKYGLPIRQVVRPVRVDGQNPPQKGKPTNERRMVHALVWDPKTNTYLCLDWKHHPWRTFIVGGMEDDEHDPVAAAEREVYEETGYKHLHLLREIGTEVREEYYAAHKGENRLAWTTGILFQLEDDERDAVADEEQEKHEPVWLSRQEIEENFKCGALDIWLDALDTWNDAYTGDGELMNSGEWDGRTASETKTQITQKVGGTRTVTYKLRDWVFSRQRYWGEPIPIVHCAACGTQPVPEKDLPVTLPNVKNYEPSGTGESPLANIPSFVNTTCPRCGGDATRETNTMPQWAGSCWYYLRYTDPSNSKKLVDPKRERRWMPVDMYVGGVEHATRHLIYARFWHKFLYQIGVVSTREPFSTLKNQGMIAGPDGQKMSKRHGNVINPDDVIAEHGADTFRTYEMFMGPFDQDAAWSTDNLIGAKRFLERVWRQYPKVTANTGDDPATEAVLHKTIKKVTDDIEQFSFNTAISQLMVFANTLDKKEKIPRRTYLILLRLLAPFAPHMTEELWRNVFGYKTSIHRASWPEHDPKRMREQTVTIAVQVNGKVRDEIEIDAEARERDVVSHAMGRDTIQRWIADTTVQRTVYVPQKLVNIVTS